VRGIHVKRADLATADRTGSPRGLPVRRCGAPLGVGGKQRGPIAAALSSETASRLHKSVIFTALR